MFSFMFILFRSKQKTSLIAELKRHKKSKRDRKEDILALGNITPVSSLTGGSQVGALTSNPNYLNLFGMFKFI